MDPEVRVRVRVGGKLGSEVAQASGGCFSILPHLPSLRVLRLGHGVCISGGCWSALASANLHSKGRTGSQSKIPPRGDLVPPPISTCSSWNSRTLLVSRKIITSLGDHEGEEVPQAGAGYRAQWVGTVLGGPQGPPWSLAATPSRHPASSPTICHAGARGMQMNLNISLGQV